MEDKWIESASCDESLENGDKQIDIAVNGKIKDWKDHEMIAILFDGHSNAGNGWEWTHTGLVRL
jgi:hypothetical protein